MILTLTRDYQDPKLTLGVLAINGKKFHTLERPWIPNKHGGKAGEKYVSCIGPGEYRLERHERPSGEKVFILSNLSLDVYRFPSDVPPGRELETRTLVLIHAGNYVHDVIGCIAPGLSRTAVGGVEGWMVTSSREAMNQLRTLIGSTMDLKLAIQYAVVGAGGEFGGGGASGGWESETVRRVNEQ